MASGPQTDQIIHELQAEVATLKQRLATVETQENKEWLSAERTAQIKMIVQNVISDAQSRGQYLDSGLGIGYDNGFYLRTADKNFAIKAKGFFQYRYTFSNAEVKNASAFGSSPPKGGDSNGFDFRYARLTLEGNLFTPNLTYCFTGDFASDGANVNDFQLVDAYFAYHFSSLLNVRAGAFFTPFSRMVYLGSGLQFVDWPAFFTDYNPDRSTGVSLFGDVIKNKLTYEVNMNDGPNSNHLGRVADASATGSLDNRLSFATRWTYLGDHETSGDFLDESDLRKDNSAFIWMVGFGADYDSVNLSSNAFPAKEGGATVAGVGGTTTAGFISVYPLNGDIYRGTLDYTFKYRGWSFTTAAFFQQINENQGAGITYPPGYDPSVKSSFFQAAYFGQLGYMITRNIEIAGRAGNSLTEGSPNQMQEYALGLNYYFYGRALKVQTDLNYIPSEANTTNSRYDTVVNTQDIIARVQLQVKF